MRKDLEIRLREATGAVRSTGFQPRPALDSAFHALDIELQKLANTTDDLAAERLTEARDMLLNSWRLVLKAHKA
jgi:hypothetical protein